ncbi:hypothetical protein Tco_0478615 [Tanacetum coccineum]
MLESCEIAKLAICLGRSGSGGGGKGLSMVELGLWDKNGVEKPVTCLGGKLGGKRCYKKGRGDRAKVLGNGKIGPSCFGPCGISLPNWQL